MDDNHATLVELLRQANIPEKRIFDLLRSLPSNFSRLGCPKKDGSLTIGWWNTGITPSGGVSNQNIQVIARSIAYFASQCDILGLGEFADGELLERILRAMPSYRSNTGIQLLEEDEQKVSFNTAIIYNSDRIAIDDNCEYGIQNLYESDKSVITGQYRIAQRVRFLVDELEAVIDSYFVHWSQHDVSIWEPKRKAKAAEMIHQNAFGNNGEFIKTAASILIGDFNTEPHETPLDELRFSRSGEYAKRFGGFFNPFWRRLHDDIGTVNGSNRDQLRTDSCLFDYIMISSPFVRLPNFSCKEYVACDLAHQPIKSQHRPVALVLNWSGIREDK